MNVSKLSLGLMIAIALPLLGNPLASPGLAQELLQRRSNQASQTINLAESAFLDRGERQSHQFYGEAQQRVTIRLSSHEFDTYLEIYDANGRLMAENDDTDSSNSSVTLTLPRTGYYTAVAKGFSRQDQGHYSLQLQTDIARRPNPPQRPQPPQPSRRVESRQVNHLFRGETLQHTFQGQAGETLTLRLESSEFDTYLRLYAPDGRLIAENDDIPYQSNSLIQVRLSQSGTYTAEVRAFSPDSEGDYTLIIGN